MATLKRETKLKTLANRQYGNGGFALVITLTLMAFVVLLLIGLLTFSRVETTTASNQLSINQARENARFALDLALSELQRHAGPDDRITIQARLLDPDFDPEGPNPNLRGGDPDSNTDPFHPFWTGVLEDRTLNGSSITNWRWLVSGNENFNLLADQANNGFLPDDSPALPANERVRLVGRGSVWQNREAMDADLAPDPYVYAPLVEMQSEVPGIQNPQTIGHYAYWVGDEGVKANLTTARYRYFEELFDGDLNRVRKEEVLRRLSPVRTGFEALPNLDVPGPLDNLFAAPFNFYFDSDYDADDIVWDRVMELGQAEVLSGFERDEATDQGLKRFYHSLTAHSNGVLADVVNARLKVDLLRNPTHPPGLLLGTGIDDYLLHPVETIFVDDAPNPDGNNPDFIYPFRHLRNPDDIQVIRPVVKNARLTTRIVGGGQGSDLEIEIMPELVIWNPYNADLSYSQGSDGYSFVLSAIYDDSEESFIVKVGAGIEWQGEVEGQQESAWNSWVSSDLDFFNIQRKTNQLDFQTNTFYRLRAGEMIYLTGENLEPGPGNDPLSEPMNTTFANNPPQGMTNATIQRSAATLYLDVLQEDLEDLGAVTLTVHAVPEGASLGNGSFEIFSRDLDLSSVTILTDIETSPLGGDPIELTYDSAEDWEADWWENVRANEVTVYSDNRNLDAGDYVNFSFQFTSNNFVSPGTNPSSESHRARDPRLTGSFGLFYSDPAFLTDTWDSPSYGNDSYVYGYEDVEQSRFMVMFDLPNDLFGTGLGDITSIGQFQHALVGSRPFLIGDYVGGEATGINEDLWDSYFVSSITDPSILPPAADLGSHTELPNPRMRVHIPAGEDPNDVLSNIGHNSGERAAENLLVQGAFNVNSTSIEAWTLLLQSFLEQELSVSFWDGGADGNGLYGWDYWAVNSAFPRFSHSAGASFYGRADINEIGNERSIWRNGFRELRPLDLMYPSVNNLTSLNPPGSPRVIEAVNWYNAVNVDYPVTGINRDWHFIAEEMARIIVAELKDEVITNGPFTSLADFVNSGILQTAINDVEWTSPTGSGTGLNWYYGRELDNPSNIDWHPIPVSAPSYLSQADILAAIGSVLTVRSDTFVIRTYGDTVNPATGEVQARAYLEAVVQRVPQPWDPNETNVFEPISPTTPGNPPYGRKFEIISVRWLSPGEI